MKKFIDKIEFAIAYFFRFLNLLVGGWRRPRWVLPIEKAISDFYKQRKILVWRASAGLIVLCGFSYGGYLYWDALPKPETCGFSVGYSPSPESPEYPQEKASGFELRFTCSAANADFLDKELPTNLVSLKPEMQGVWRWTSDRRLHFQPSLSPAKQDWVRGQKYEVQLKKEVVAKHIVLEKMKTDFKVSEFLVSASSPEFYIDPVVETNKRARITFTFNSPVDIESFKRNIRGEYVHLEKPLTSQKDKSELQIRFNKFNTAAYVLSDQIQSPLLSGEFHFYLRAGIRPVVGGPATEKDFDYKLVVPAKKGYFRLESSQAVIAKDENFEPLPTLIINTNLDIQSEAISKKLKVWELPHDIPVKKKNSERRNWSSPSEITPEVRALLKAVPFKTNPSSESRTKTHSFQLEVQPDSFIFIEVDAGLVAYGGYESDAPFVSVVKIPEVPSEINIMGRGMLLSLSGEKKLSVMARAIGPAKIEIARILPERLPMAIEQFATYRDLKEPSLYEQEVYKTSTVVEKEFLLGDKNSTKPYYHTINVGELLKGDHGRGLFHITISSKDGRVSERRLILVTDLGVITKKSKNGRLDIFVQSISTGQPVANAQVIAVGQNGESSLSVQTDSQGHAEMPDLSSFKREKEVHFLSIKKGADTSFIFPDKSSQQLDYSRFDVAGLRESSSSDALTTMIFSERGLYRPGDDIHFGLITRSKNIKKQFKEVSVKWKFVDPRGLIAKSGVLSVTAGNVDELNLKTEENSPTGTYNLSVYIEKKKNDIEIIGSESVRVEEFEADRMRNATKLSKTELNGWVDPKDLRVNMNLQNLFGTPAAARKVTGRIVVAPISPRFRNLKDWQFAYINSKNDLELSESLPEGITNDKGEKAWDLPLDKYTSGMYRVSVFTEGFEAGGGRSVSAAVTSLMSPLPYLVGIKPSSDQSYLNAGVAMDVELLAINSQLKQIEVKNLQVELWETKYVSILQERYDGTYAYQSTLKEELKEKKSARVPAEGMKWALLTETPGDYVLVLKTAEGQEVNRYTYSVAGQKNLSKKLDRNAELKLVLNRTDFDRREQIEMQIRAPYTGAGLITIERDQVYAYKWFKATTTESVQTIQIPEGLEGNAYVTVTFVRDLSSPEIFMSPLSYATAPFSISLKNFKTKIDLSAPELVKPGEKLRISYSADHPTDLILYGVDQGILQVANYKLPQPLNFFFQKRALEVLTAQILDLILPEYSRLKESSAGGDEAYDAVSKNLNPFKRKSQPPVVFWSGRLRAGAQAKFFDYEVPDYYNGSIKIMAVASNSSGMGAAETSTTVRGDIILTPTAPLFTTPGDQFEMTVSVANQMVGSGAGATISLNLVPNEYFQIVEGEKVTLKIDEGREEIAKFKIKTLDKLGASTLKIEAKGDGGKAHMNVSMGVRPATPYHVVTQTGVEKSLPLSLETKEDLYSELRKKIFSLSGGPVAFSTALIEYLEQYPYGCTEQVLSQAFPGLLKKTRSILNLKKGKELEYFNKAIGNLRLRQTSSGGFGLFSGYDTPDTFITLYALLYLTEAGERGYPVPPELKERALDFVETLSLNPQDDIASIRYGSMAQYLLARNRLIPKTDILGFVKKMQEQKGLKKNDISLAFIASTLKILKYDKEADQLMSSLSPINEMRFGEFEFYDPLIHSAFFVYLTAKHFQNRVNQLVSVDEMTKIFEPVTKQMYASLSAAQLLMAIEAIYDVSENQNLVKGLELFQKGKASESTDLLKGTYYDQINLTGDTVQLRLSGQNKMPIFYSTVEAGFSRVVRQAPEAKGIEVQRSYVKKDKVVTTVQQGDEVEVRVRIRATDQDLVQNVALVDLFPSGFELVQDSISFDEEGDGEYEEAGSKTTSGMSAINVRYADRREDRIVLYAQAEKEMREYVYKLKAVSVGEFVVPPPYAEDMYNRKVYFHGAGSKISVKGND